MFPVLAASWMATAEHAVVGVKKELKPHALVGRRGGLPWRRGGGWQRPRAPGDRVAGIAAIHTPLVSGCAG